MCTLPARIFCVYHWIQVIEEAFLKSILPHLMSLICSISLTQTLSRLIYREEQCFSRCCASTPVTFKTSWKSSCRLAVYLKKKWKSMASDWDQRFHSVLSPIFQMHYWTYKGHMFPGKWRLAYDSPLDSSISRLLKAKLTFGSSIL